MSLPLFLQDKKFLKLIDKLRVKLEFIKITVLNWKELPLEEVQGKVISGSINVDGSSSLRRTANLSIFAELKDNNLANIDQLFSINKKCIILLGIVNTVPISIIEGIDPDTDLRFIYLLNYQLKYGNIVWFPLGVYVMFNPSLSHSISGVTISMQLKDKMCLLNGDLGGNIHSSVDFAYQDLLVDINAMSIEKNPVLVYNIIKELVNHWGNLSLSKIIISEVPLKIKQIVKWTGEDPIYVLQTNKDGNYQLCTYGLLLPLLQNNPNLTFYGGFTKGEDMGYIYTDFTYPGKELVCNAGDSVTSVLDKIISVMGNYEYFYDVLGNFVFQLKQNYLNMSNTAYWSKSKTQSDNSNINISNVGDIPVDAYLADTYRLSRSVYDFTDNDFTVSFNNSLNFNNIKNDFVVWGTYTSISLQKYPCRFHLAIDKKPSLNSHKIVLFTDDDNITRAVAAIGNEDQDKIINRRATDWRLLIYYQMLEDELYGTGLNTELNNTYFQYYAELKLLFPKLYDLRKWEDKIKLLEEKIQLSTIPLEKNQLNLTLTKIKNIHGNDKVTAVGWKDLVSIYPENIVYFLDFIDDDSALGQYSVNNIGRRSKIIDSNNLGVNCVFEPNIPDIVYVLANQNSTDLIRSMLTSYGQYFTQIHPNDFLLLSIGGKLNSCFERVKDLLYQYTHINNSISITTLPIYYLLPNTRITVLDSASGIYGDYIIQSMSIPLDVTSTMSINAYKALQKI